MAEKEPQFTVTDRRKFTLDGELRPGAPVDPPREVRTDLIPDPAPVAEPTTAAAAPAPEAELPAAELPADDAEYAGTPTADQAADALAGYRETTAQLDTMLRARNLGGPPVVEMSFERLTQSLYMTAMMQLGAGAQPGEQPRVDLLGARQTIDMLGVIAAKSSGNLTAPEQKLLDSALFELRMTFLEITDALSRSAAAAAPGKPGAPAPVKGGPVIVR